jgi:hypothetical protein
MADHPIHSPNPGAGGPAGEAGQPGEPERKVKELIDAATRAELEAWFSLPSYEQLAEQGKPAAPPEDDAELVALRKRRADAIAAVDPALLEEHRLRTEPQFELIKFKAVLELQIDPDLACFDHSMVDRQRSVAEPRYVEIPEHLEDDLKERVPQALLRDLHRPEIDFTKVFEIVDPLAEQRVSMAAVIRKAMAPRKLELPGSRFPDACAARREFHRELRKPWAEAAKLPMPNRRVTE